jgi:hypothetical protein
MPTTKVRPLTLPELSVLKFTEHYGLTVVEAAARLPALKRQSQADVERLIGRLVNRRMMTETWLYPGRRCYYLTTKAIEATRVPVVGRHFDDRPLSEESKIRKFAMLSFCCLGMTPRLRLSAAVLQNTYPTLEVTSFTASYYLQMEPNRVFGFLRVDMGGEGRWDRVVAKCAEDARRIANSPTWREHVAAGRFEITLATALSQKAERLGRALEETPPLLPIRIAVIPELLNLIAPTPN